MTALRGGAGVPAGTPKFFAGSTPPRGYLKANGAAVSRTAYARLFAAIGTTYGAGDGLTTFNLPDDRGEFIRGWDDGRGVDAGRVFGSTQSDAFKSHTHASDPGGGYVPSSRTGVAINVSGTSARDSIYSTGAAGGTETRPRNRAYLACIKY